MVCCYWEVLRALLKGILFLIKTVVLGVNSSELEGENQSSSSENCEEWVCLFYKTKYLKNRPVPLQTEIMGTGFDKKAMACAIVSFLNEAALYYIIKVLSWIYATGPYISMEG